MARREYQRARQPQQPAAINWGNPLARGLVFEASGATRLRDAVRGIWPSAIVGDNSQLVTPFGVAVDCSSDVFSYGAGGILTGNKVTFLVIEKPNSLTQVAGLFNKRTSAGTQNSFSFGYNYSVGNEFSVDFGDADGAGGTVGFAYSFARSAFSTSGNVIAITADGSLGATQKIRLWRNGQEIAQSAAPLADQSVPQFFTGTANLEVGRVNSTTSYYSGSIVLLRSWNRVLSTAEVLEISRNPWKLFRSPQRRQRAPPTTPTLSLPTAFNITATTVTPRVTVTF